MDNITMVKTTPQAQAKAFTFLLKFEVEPQAQDKPLTRLSEFKKLVTSTNMDLVAMNGQAGLRQALQEMLFVFGCMKDTEFRTVKHLAHAPGFAWHELLAPQEIQNGVFSISAQLGGAPVTITLTPISLMVVNLL